MYKVRFYKDEKGIQPVADYLKSLEKKRDKDSRIKLNKIRDYIKALQTFGTFVGEPIVKHLDGDIWELRPLQDRIFFAAWVKDEFILLHQYKKKSQKTPPREIEKAKHELANARKGAEQ